MIEYKRVGGLRFLRVGQFGCSWYVTTRHAPLWDADRAACAFACIAALLSVACL